VVLALITLLAGVIVMVPALIKRIRRDADKRQLLKFFKVRGAKYVKDVAFPDGMDGYVFVDYLLLTPAGVVVVDLQDYNGFIFGGPNLEQWTQMVHYRGYKFANPVQQIALCIHAIKSHAKNVPVLGHVVFSSACEFPKGVPQGVSQFSTFNDDINYLFEGASVPEAYEKIWQELLDAAIDSKSQQWKDLPR
jgi:hypothetical protein